MKYTLPEEALAVSLKQKIAEALHITIFCQTLVFQEKEIADWEILSRLLPSESEVFLFIDKRGGSSFDTWSFVKPVGHEEFEDALNDDERDCLVLWDTENPSRTLSILSRLVPDISIYYVDCTKYFGEKILPRIKFFRVDNKANPIIYTGSLESVTELIQFMNVNSTTQWDVASRLTKLKFINKEHSPKVLLTPPENMVDLASKLPGEVYSKAISRVNSKIPEISAEISSKFAEFLVDSRWIWQATAMVDLEACLNKHKNTEVAQSYLQLCLKLLWERVGDMLQHELEQFLVKTQDPLGLEDEVDVSRVEWTRQGLTTKISFTQAFVEVGNTSHWLLLPVLAFTPPVALAGGLGGLFLGTGSGVLNTLLMGIIGTIAAPISLVVTSIAAITGLTAAIAVVMTTENWNYQEWSITSVEEEAAKIVVEMLQKPDMINAINENIARVLTNIFRENIPEDLVERQIAILSSSQRLFSRETDFSRWRVVSVKVDETSLNEDAVRFLFSVLHNGATRTTRHRFSECRELYDKLCLSHPEKVKAMSSFPPKTWFKSKAPDFLLRRSTELLSWLTSCEEDEVLFKDENLVRFLDLD
eukprot:TRINITY_DN6173_c0_g1_i3.p1 TRINITY_DN6173_c0_g1~~TRINITY_DN6173_c0_g1_i3.p1  ORF type:complete len:588 (+),score=103.45 TRINITY_DN6173_c0_g1_i3:155-1918(+)